MNDEMDYEQIALELQIEAKRGVAESQCLLGQMYSEGLGVRQDYEQAAVWLRKAAEQGHAEAQYHLGLQYQNGQGVEQDPDKAAAWLRRSAKQGNAEAQAILNAIQAASRPKPAPEAPAAPAPAPAKSAEGRAALRFPVKKAGLLAAAVLVVALAGLGLWRFWPGRSMDISGVVAKVMPATVFISVETEKGGATGSGFFALDGRIFTNAHVVENAKRITIKTHEGKTYDAEVWDENKDLDLAVLNAKVDRGDYSNLAFTSEIPAPGSEVVVIGSPLGYEQTVSNGLVSAVRHYDNDLTLLQISAPISPGSSGSPVVNMRGQVVGVATLTSTKGQNLNFAVSHTSVNRELSRRDTYLVQSGAPIVTEDAKTGLLRVNGGPTPSGVSKSPENDRVKVLDTKKLEVRTLARVRSEAGRKTYWIDSNSVKRPVRMRLDDFLEKFNDGLSSGERLERSDFSVKPSEASCRRGGRTLRLKLDKDGNITQVSASVSRTDETVAELHSWVQQTAKVYYPNSLIARSFFVELLGMAVESLTLSNILSGYHAQVEKFPVLFDMSSTARDCTLTVFVNDPAAHKQDLAKVVANAIKPSPADSTPAEQPRKKKTNVRDPKYLNEIRAAIQGMPVVREDVFRNLYHYFPQKYSTYARRLMFEPYIAHSREDGGVDLFLCIGFRNSDWVFTKKIIFNCDGKNFSFDSSNSTFFNDGGQREVIWGGGIYELYTGLLLYSAASFSSQQEETSLIESILSAKKVRVRFDGKYVADRTLSKQDIQNMKKCYDVYKKLVEVEKRWD